MTPLWLLAAFTLSATWTVLAAVVGTAVGRIIERRESER